MKIFLSLIAVVGLFASVGTCAVGKSAVHEIEALVLLLISVVCFVGVSILERLDKPK